jgi:hypothetical protein
MATLMNLTPHEVVLVRGETRLVVPPSGTVARVASDRRVAATIEVDGLRVPINEVVFGQVENLPDPAEGVFYVVSALVARALPERQDLLVPDDTLRDERGQIVGARALARV